MTNPTPAAPSVPEEGRGPCQYVMSMTGGPCGEDREAMIHQSGWLGSRYDRPVHPFTFRDRRGRDRRVTPASTPSHDGLRDSFWATVKNAVDRIDAFREAGANATADADEEETMRSMWGRASRLVRSLPAAATASTGLDALQRLHDEAEMAVRGAESNPLGVLSPATQAHLGGQVVGIRKAMAVLGATEVRTDTGTRSLAEYARLVPSTEATEATEAAGEPR